MKIKNVFSEQIRKRILRIFGVAILLMLFFCFVPIPLKVTRSLTGLQWQNRNPNYQEKAVDISVDGLYCKYLLPWFKEDTFRGKFTISGFECTVDECRLMKISFSKLPSMGGNLIYVYKHQVYYIGRLLEKNLFSSVHISLSDESGTEKGQDIYISAPAATREEAVALAIEFDEVGYKFE